MAELDQTSKESLLGRPVRKDKTSVRFDMGPPCCTGTLVVARMVELQTNDGKG
jgi:hypothetical protein